MTIVTKHLAPPIPVPDWEWEARFDDDENGPTGHGPDEVSAIMDLMNNLEDNDD